MPGCIIPGCHTNRNNKAYDGISLFKLPNCAGDFYQNWKHRIVDVLKRYLSMDGEAWEQRIKSGKVWMCERHYKPEDFERTKTGKKTLRLEALPTENLPENCMLKEEGNMLLSLDTPDEKDASPPVVVVTSSEECSTPSSQLAFQETTMSAQLDHSSTRSSAQSPNTSGVPGFSPDKPVPGVSEVRPWPIFPSYIPQPHLQSEQGQVQPQFLRASPFVPIHVPPGIQKMTDGSASSAPHPYAYYPVMPCSPEGYPVQFLYYPVKIPVNPVRPMMANKVGKEEKRENSTATMNTAVATTDPKPPESHQPMIEQDSVQAVKEGGTDERPVLQSDEPAVFTIENPSNFYSANNKTLAEEMRARSAMQPRASSLVRKRRQLSGIVDRVTEAAAKKQNRSCTNEVSCNNLVAAKDSIIPFSDRGTAVVVNTVLQDTSSYSCEVPSGSKPSSSRCDRTILNVRTSFDACKTKHSVTDGDQDLSSIDDIRSILKSPMEPVDGMFSFSPLDSPSGCRLSITSANNVSAMTLNTLPSTRASNAHLKFCKTINTGVMASSSYTSTSSSSFSTTRKCPSSTAAMLLSLASTALDTTHVNSNGKHSPSAGGVTPCTTNIPYSTVPCAFSSRCDGSSSITGSSLYTMSSTSMSLLTQPSPSTFSNAATSYAEKQKLIQENTAPTLLLATKKLLAKDHASNAGTERKTPEPTPYEQKLIDVVSSSIDSLSTMRTLPRGRSHGRQIVGNNGCDSLALRSRRGYEERSPFSDLCQTESESEEYHALIEMSILQSANHPVHSNPTVGNTNFPCITSPPLNTSLRRDVQVSSCVATDSRNTRVDRKTQDLIPLSKPQIAPPPRHSVEDFTPLYNDIPLDQDIFDSPLSSRNNSTEMAEHSIVLSPLSSVYCTGEEFGDVVGTEEPRVLVEDVRSDDTLKNVMLGLSGKPEYEHIDFRLFASRGRTKRKAIGQNNSFRVIRTKRSKMMGADE